MALHPDTIAWVRTVCASEAVVAGPLGGGVTSEVYALAGNRFVVKQVSNERWLQERPDVVAYEARILEQLAGSSVPVPRLVAVDPDGTGAGFPTLLMAAAAGAPAGDVAAPSMWMDEMASTSAAILELPIPGWLRTFERYQAAETARAPAWASDPGLWKAAIDVVREPAPAAQVRFVHRDYHPWNVLWMDGITAVVDWSQAAAGPAPMDAAHCRANLALRFDIETAEAYREAWEAASGMEHRPYWDIVTCIDFTPDWRPSVGGNRRLEVWLRFLLGRAG